MFVSYYVRVSTFLAQIFTNFITFFIVLTSITSGVIAGISYVFFHAYFLGALEYSHQPEEYKALLTGLSVIESISLFVFIGEIALHWIDDFHAYWKDNWNIFDFVLTVAVSLLLSD